MEAFLNLVLVLPEPAPKGKEVSFSLYFNIVVLGLWIAFKPCAICLI
jgi:hypothetical protein